MKIKNTKIIGSTESKSDKPLLTPEMVERGSTLGEQIAIFQSVEQILRTDRNYSGYKKEMTTWIKNYPDDVILPVKEYNQKTGFTDTLTERLEEDVTRITEGRGTYTFDYKADRRKFLKLFFEMFHLEGELLVQGVTYNQLLKIALDRFHMLETVYQNLSIGLDFDTRFKVHPKHK